MQPNIPTSLHTKTTAVENGDICAVLLEQPNIPTSLHTKTTAVENGIALSYHKVRELYFLAVVFVTIIYTHVLLFLEESVDSATADLYPS